MLGQPIPEMQKSVCPSVVTRLVRFFGVTRSPMLHVEHDAVRQHIDDGQRNDSGPEYKNSGTDEQEQEAEREQPNRAYSIRDADPGPHPSRLICV